MTAEKAMERWSSVTGLQSVDSPQLLIDVDAVQQNIDHMVQCAGGNADRLRPHMKTHKSSEIIRRCVEKGVDRFKASTLSEAAVAAVGGASQVLLAHQPIGPKKTRLIELCNAFPRTIFSAVVDNLAVAQAIGDAVPAGADPLDLWIDVDCGMHRTGIPFGESLDRLIDGITNLSRVRFAGLHVYDGHIHDSSIQTRQERARKIIRSVHAFMEQRGAVEVICGGSPTFGIYAQETDFQCSPGTTVYWDWGYADQYPEMPYTIAAALLTRVVSHPGDDTWCLDLGYKSVACEMPLDLRVRLPQIPDVSWVGHSEEHLVIKTSMELKIGQELLAFPKHICPTVAQYNDATIVHDLQVTSQRLVIDARGRRVPTSDILGEGDILGAGHS